MKLYYLGKAKIMGYDYLVNPEEALYEEQIDPKALFKTKKEAQGVAEACEKALAKALNPNDSYCLNDLWDIFEIDSNKLELQSNGYFKLVN